MKENLSVGVTILALFTLFRVNLGYADSCPNIVGNYRSGSDVAYYTTTNCTISATMNSQDLSHYLSGSWQTDHYSYLVTRTKTTDPDKGCVAVMNGNLTVDNSLNPTVLHAHTYHTDGKCGLPQDVNENRDWSVVPPN